MKDLVGFDQEIGGDGAKVKGSLGIEMDQMKLQVAVTYPIAKVIEPVMKVLDGLVDQVEQLIPGDQVALAQGLKNQAREELVKLLSEQA